MAPRGPGFFDPLSDPEREKAPQRPAAYKANGKHPPEPPPVEDHSRAIIRVLNGFRHMAADFGVAALAAARVPFYERNRHLVRAATLKAKTCDGVMIEVPCIVRVTKPILARALGKVAEWERLKADGEPVRIDPPKEVVEQIADMLGEWPFPPLTGLIATPTMRPNGSILSASGYDHATGLLLLSPPDMPEVLAKPRRDNAEAALELLMGLLSEFPLADDGGTSCSVIISMLLTPVLRGAFVTAPMHAVTAPQPGTGKSYLADLSSMIATGERCPVISMAPNDPNESEKRLVMAAMSGQPIISIDNCSEMLVGDFLNQVTERPILQLRPLGTSDGVRVPNTFCVFANGNNLAAPADLMRRTLVARLDANMENPEERVFDQSPLKLIQANRGAYIAACLTIGRAYIVAGRPGRLNPLASFEQWSDLVRSAIVWLGLADPCKSMQLARAQDPIQAAKAAVFTSWERGLGLKAEGYTVKELIENAEFVDAKGFVYPDLRDALLTVASDRTGSSISSKSLGRWFLRHEKNRIGDLKLTVDRSNPSRLHWVLSRA